MSIYIQRLIDKNKSPSQIATCLNMSVNKVYEYMGIYNKRVAKGDKVLVTKGPYMGLTGVVIDEIDIPSVKDRVLPYALIKLHSNPHDPVQILMVWCDVIG